MQDGERNLKVRVLWRAAVALIAAGTLSFAQQGGNPAATATAGPVIAAPGIEESWDSLIQDVLPHAKIDPSLVAARPVVKSKPNPAADFLNHLFFETRTEYDRYSTSFTGNPTTGSIINAPFNSVITPGVTTGIGWPPAFENNANRVYGFIDLGTRGWLSDRVNTHFAMRYRQDLTPTSPVSPAGSVLETFRGNRLLDLTEASVEIGGRPTDGFFSNASLTIGRQYIYGAEIAAIDGAQFTWNRPRYALTVFGGRRFTYYSDPYQRATGGANLVLKLSPDTSVELESLYYVRGSNSVTMRRRLRTNLSLSSYSGGLQFTGAVYAGERQDDRARELLSKAFE
jgi:hypothetical protein